MCKSLLLFFPPRCYLVILNLKAVCFFVHTEYRGGELGILHIANQYDYADGICQWSFTTSLTPLFLDLVVLCFHLLWNIIQSTKKVQNYWPHQLHTLKQSSSSQSKFPYIHLIELQRVLNPTALKLNVNIAVIFHVDAKRSAVQRKKPNQTKTDHLKHILPMKYISSSPTVAVMRSLTRKKIGQLKHFKKPL